MIKSYNIWLFGALSLFFYTFSVAQPANRADDFGYDFNDYIDAVVGHNGAMIGFGRAMEESDGVDRIGVLLTRYGPSNEVQLQNFITDTATTSAIINNFAVDYLYGGLIPTGDDGYLFNAVTSRNNSIIVKLNRDLQEEFRYEYQDSNAISNFTVVEPIELEGGYLLYGTAKALDGSGAPYARRINKVGETQWVQYYGEEGATEIVQDGTMQGDSILVISCTKSEQFYNIIYKINVTDGTLQSEWASEVYPETGLIRQIVALEDGSLITFGEVFEEYYPDGWLFSMVQSVIARLSPVNSVQWANPAGPPHLFGNGQEGSRELKLVSDGNIVSAGEHSTWAGGSKKLAGWLFKFTPEGDTLWSRYYLPPFDLSGENVSGQFGRFGELPNGDLIVGGKSRGDGRRNCWLVRTDAQGCPSLDSCAYVVTSEEWAPSPAEPEVTVFPNPACRHLTVAWPGAVPTGTGHFTLYNLQGQPVWSVIKPSAPEVPLQLPELPPGMYALRVESEGQVWVERVVIQ
ncbi:MAG: T9SS type A sorting domain-containing protein [Phaeodactylibacter xiamenensis]|uniref:Secretion system C-terminal sorting domain-containing protein n=1 Tax=Phaeodactylibacter xiamenensis TaxID=1524460 RepID=A0A098S6D4_9BACT|nr:T9SS type A sorting domain-containing protein [Phaeodactylibacter xiamenensis]KGE87889.1 hypothetical protein IX84_12220 [Phaeodactylibacter xiamenensis]